MGVVRKCRRLLDKRVVKPAQKKLVPSVCRGHSNERAMPVFEKGLPTHCVLA
tara:strand:- start:203 stop:358 length:156 start_codon:yes stop_codon:yes gene_type:complete